MRRGNRKGGLTGQVFHFRVKPPGRLCNTNACTPSSPISAHPVVLPDIMNPWNGKALPFQTRSSSLRVEPTNTLNKPFKTANVLLGVVLFRHPSACNSPALIAELKLKPSWGTGTWQLSSTRIHEAYKQEGLVRFFKATKQYGSTLPSLLGRSVLPRWDNVLSKRSNASMLQIFTFCVLQRFEQVWSCTASAAQWCIANNTLIGNDGAWTYNITACGKKHHTLHETKRLSPSLCCTEPNYPWTLF